MSKKKKKDNCNNNKKKVKTFRIIVYWLATN